MSWSGFSLERCFLRVMHGLLCALVTREFLLPHDHVGCAEAPPGGGCLRDGRCAAVWEHALTTPHMSNLLIQVPLLIRYCVALYAAPPLGPLNVAACATLP